MSGYYDLTSQGVPGYSSPALPADYALAFSGYGQQQAPAFGTGSVPGVAAPAAGGGGWNFLPQFNADGRMTDMGVGMPALQAASGLFNAYMGMKQYGLYKDQLQESKKQFALNYDAQRQTTNSALEDRQRARVASNAGAYQSVGEYMDQNGIRGR